MKTLHVTIRLGVGPHDDGAFDNAVVDAKMIHWALMRAFPLCHGSAIEVAPVNICDLVTDDELAGSEAAGRELVENLRTVREGERADLVTLIWQRMVDRAPTLYSILAQRAGVQPGVLDVVRDVLNRSLEDFAAGVRPKTADEMLREHNERGLS